LKLEEIQDLIHEGIATDWEHGVAWMNDEAAAEFKRKYPTIWEALMKIMDLEEMD
jgi:hypothetical protein